MSDKAIAISINTKKHKEYTKNMTLTIGMKPLNAALAAGYNKQQAELLAGTEEAKKLFELKASDIAEIKGFTLPKLIAHLMLRSGFNGKVDEYTDQKIQLGYLKELIKLVTDSNNEEEADDEAKTINIHFHAAEEQGIKPVTIDVGDIPDEPIEGVEEVVSDE